MSTNVEAWVGYGFNINETDSKKIVKWIRSKVDTEEESDNEIIDYYLHQALNNSRYGKIARVMSEGEYDFYILINPILTEDATSIDTDWILSDNLGLAISLRDELGIKSKVELKLGLMRY